MVNLKRTAVSLGMISLMSVALCSCPGAPAYNGAHNRHAKAVNNVPEPKKMVPGRVRRLRLDDIDLNEKLTMEEVLSVWGKPDADEGSGFHFMVYELEDGRELWLEFNDKEPPCPLLSAKIYAGPADTEGRMVCAYAPYDPDPNTTNPGVWPQPGDITRARCTVEQVRDGCVADGFVYLGTDPAEAAARIPKEHYVVAFFVDPYQDYHCYRMNPDGTWSSKRGAHPVDCLDASGNLIHNVQAADHNYGRGANYRQFVGYFAVPRGGIRVN